jgi:hypothetical protein
MNKITLTAVSVFLIGCSQQNPKTVELKLSPDGKAITVDVEKAAASMKKQQDAEEQLIQTLKSDHEPLLSLASEKVRSSLAETIGTEAAKSATVTADASSVKEFGPKKWKLRGTLHAVEDSGTERNTTWEVTMQVMFGKLQATIVRLDVKPE